ncbi:SDR family oxidoreductase [Streptomyces sp. SPB162]|uniref:SDR family oxidoreductase n=1 Tax=Streptomyces sp. SPB162 TaxID=2940560 RepID=UPI002406C6EB|nr:SDR family oxidoreductase [Streptomyces sp. SPB162]MDF9812751.1 NAD(P)-dependent dehydrogenase (short-subunit alcohol dehydrogenase family) [Streptomyces sp. SPB162]
MADKRNDDDGPQGEPDGRLDGKVVLVAGATRGAGRAMAVELGRAGAVVYATGRTTRERRSEVNRPETIEETAELIDRAGGTGIAVLTDHLDPEQVRALVDRIDRDHGRLDVLVNDTWGGEAYIDFDTKMWDIDLAKGLRMLRLGVDSHLITSHCALPLLIRRPGGLVVEITDGTAESNEEYRNSLFFDVTKNVPIRMAYGLGKELEEYGCTAVSLTPGFLRSEQMLDTFGVTEANWRDGAKVSPHFVIAESPTFIGRAVTALATDPDVARWNGRSLSSGQLARVYGFTDTDGSRPDAWRYISEVAIGGKDAPVEEYR